MSKKEIVAGSKEWESICVRCGLCCLVKYCDNLGNIFLTDVRCDMLDPETGNCGCYSANVAERSENGDTCAKHSGSVLNYETLQNDYVVPGTQYVTYALGIGSVSYEDIGAKVPYEMARDAATNDRYGNLDIETFILNLL